MTTKEKKIKDFDPNGIGLIDNGIFGLPFNEKESEIIIIEVPWDVTVSSGSGTSLGPKNVLEESYQVDLFLPSDEEAWKRGIFLIKNPEIHKKSKNYRNKVEEIIDLQANGFSIEQLKDRISEINKECEGMVDKIKKQSLKYLKKGKTVGLLGGDHSTPLGLIQALACLYPSFGILQIDAHCDLREAYEGFEYSHASIMTNALKLPQVSHLIQIGIRDYSEDENQIIKTSHNRIVTFFDKKIKEDMYLGKTWNDQCNEIISKLPDLVYLSFDIDGLDPKLCPKTGTPVMGGFEAEQIIFLIEKIVKSGRKIIAFDLNEIGNDSFDGNVGARLLYKISNLVYETRNNKNY